MCSGCAEHIAVDVGQEDFGGGWCEGGNGRGRGQHVFKALKLGFDYS